jgi:uncharacterized protein YjiK
MIVLLRLPGTTGRRPKCTDVLRVLAPAALALACGGAASSDDARARDAAESAAAAIGPAAETAGAAVAELASRSAMPADTAPQTSGALAGFALGAGDGARVELPGRLAEISGLAVTADGRVLAHNDERGEVFEIDATTGRVVRSFQLGENRVAGDFEGIAVTGRRLFLMASDGTLVEFQEAADGGRAPFREIATGLRERCEFEGLEYDARTDALLLACKNPRGAELRDRLVVFAWSLRTNALEPAPRFAVPLDFLTAAGERAELHPSGIAVHPRTGSFLIVAAQENLLVEVAAGGRILGVRSLPRGRHPQAEGVAVLPNGDLLVSDERRGGGLLTVYRAGQGDREPR